MSATNRGAVRIGNDAYQTPEYSIKPLFELVRWNKVNSFLEPCKGDGNILNMVPSHITQKYFTEITETNSKGKPLDYLKARGGKVDLIITNPPYNQASKFILKALNEADTVCMLLRLNFLEGKERKRDLWSKIDTPNKLLVLSKRPSFTGKGTDATGYAWFCWDRKDLINAKEGITILPYVTK